MNYFVTGGTGFIGSHIIERLLNRGGTVHVLVREGSESKFEALQQRTEASQDRLLAVTGDVLSDRLGLSDAVINDLRGQIDHFIHLAAVYDLMLEDEEAQSRVNVDGTRHALSTADALEAGCFHHMSSIAVAGLYKGFWSEDMFEEADQYQEPYFRTKREAEAVVRNTYSRPFRIYRPGAVTGDSEAGAIDKVDGPYYMFTFIKKVRKALPPWVPIAGLEGGEINIVPVDFVADGFDYLAHRDGLDGRCFHLTDPKPYRAGEALNIFAQAAHAPRFAMRIDSRMLDIVPVGIRNAIFHLPPVRRIVDAILSDFGLPKPIMTYLNYPVRIDSRETQRELADSGITCPDLKSYAPALWDYWERNLDPDLSRDRTLSGAVREKVVVITGASSGIGRSAAIKIGAAGARTVVIARSEEQLSEVKEIIDAAGGEAHCYAADISDMESCDAVIDGILEDLGQIDVLVNNAGRSIRRSVSQSFDRFHDYERTMRLNYFGAIRLILRTLPSMLERQSGHVVNVSSMGVLASPPRFSAYIASKSALDAFSRCVRAEVLDKNVQFTTINMPLVRTPMINPVSFYEHVPALTPDEAADMITEAIIDKPKRIATRLGVFAQVMTAILPQVADVIMNTAYKLFPESTAKDKDGKPVEDASSEAVLFASVMRGVYW
jgi:NAD(P)-dependent dehydrogenase (short-subunit alcohol dehydrogenase family)